MTVSARSPLEGEILPPVVVDVLALGRLRRGASVRDLAFYAAADLELFAAWARSGLASWPFARLDRCGLVLTFRLPALDAARPLLDLLPSVAAELIVFDLVPLTPLRV